MTMTGTRPALLAPFIEYTPYSTLQAAAPDAEAEGWAPTAGFVASSDFAELCDHVAGQYRAPRPAATTLAFQQAIWSPVNFAGFSFLTTGRTPRLHDTVVAQLTGEHRVASRLREESDGDGEGVQALRDEIDRYIAPIVTHLARPKLFSALNAWGIVLDALRSSIPTAGTVTGDPALVASRWAQMRDTIQWPSKRLPRPFSFEVDGVCHDRQIRAGCCLYFTSEAAKAEGPSPFCVLCPAERDDRRIERLAVQLRAAQ